MAEPSSSALVAAQDTGAAAAAAAAGGGGGAAAGGAGDVGGMREYRKGNWTLHETVVLIAAKKMDDERRLKGGDRERNRTAELRWKWIENYCWRHGCHRNQNQCNDKWDNLLRDYKKVRDYEMRVAQNQQQQQQLQGAGEGSSTSTSQGGGQALQSYWVLEKHERKERGLPSNLVSQVYEALHEVVDKRYPPRLITSPTAIATTSGTSQQQQLQQLPVPLHPLPSNSQLMQQQQEHPLSQPQQQQLLLQQQQQQQQSVSLQDKPTTMVPPLPHPSLVPAAQSSLPSTSSHHHLPQHHMHHPPIHHHPGAGEASESSESEGSEIPPSPAKRQKVGGGEQQQQQQYYHHHYGGAGPGGGGHSGGVGLGLGPAVAQSTTELTQTLLACEEKKDRRHRDLLGVEERKLHIEKTKAEISREGIAGLIAAINNLSSAILSLASSDKHS